MSVENRLAELEIKLAYTEDLLDTLNTTVFRQQQEIDRLREALRNLHQQVQTATPAEQRDLRDEIPPHY